LAERGDMLRRRCARDRGLETELILAAQDGHDWAVTELMGRYRNFVRGKARCYFLAGAGRDDIVQEGMIGLFKAIRDYRPDRQSSFRSFAELCVTRQLITAIKTATRQKHTPLNTYVSLNKPMARDGEGDRVLADILAANEICDPAEIVVSEWEAESIRQGFTAALSGFETSVLRLYMEGKSYHDIADMLDRRVKSVDNALQRVKRKIEDQVRRTEAC
jgi:RNA polymerase sporulation-specific sigma factor